MDNGTMVESFKFLNYCQLAKNSLASKRFRDVIRTHRHKLALLVVEDIFMYNYYGHLNPVVVKIFSSEHLSLEEYNKWTDRNKYSKQIPIESQIAGKESTGNGHNFVEFIADAFRSLSKYFPSLPNHHRNIHEFRADINKDRKSNYHYYEIFAKAELKDETWPVFQHFFRLIMDPFIYIRSFEWGDLAYKNDVFSLLTREMNPDRGRLQCERLRIGFDGDTQKFLAWIKDHVRCDEFVIDSFDKNYDSNYHEGLLDFFMTGAPCTSVIDMLFNDLSRIIVDFVQNVLETILGWYLGLEQPRLGAALASGMGRLDLTLEQLALRREQPGAPELA